MPGSAGWTPSAGFGPGFSWTLAGHSLAGWSLGGGAVAPQIPWPSLQDVARPLVFDDSLVIHEGGEGGRGPDAALAGADERRNATRGVRARSVFRLENGEFGLNRYSLMFERGDSARWVRYEVASGRRDAFADLGVSGDHIWNLAASWSRGPHHFAGTVGQRGVARQLGHADVGENASGQSGGATYEWRRAGRRFGVEFQRGLDHREDIIDVENIPLSFSRREGQENRVEAKGIVPFADGQADARLLWSRARVVRYYDDAFDARNTTWWGSVGLERAAAGGRARVEVGGGRSDALKRDLFAPSASLGFGNDAIHGRVVAERVAHPVWSDLAPGQPAFLQRTDALGFEAGAHGAKLGGDVALRTGITHDRALVFPYPIEDIWLRAGVSAESRRYTFALFTAGAHAAWRRLAVGASGFALGRDQDVSEPRVEPDFGMRAYVEQGFSAFQNDLGVRVRAEGAAIGERESKTGGDEVVLPGYWTSAAVVVLTIADATATLRLSNLEDRRHEEPWIDPGTGLLARGPGRSRRFTFTWRFLN